MHAGRPYGLHVVGKGLTEKDEAFISATAMRFTNLKSVSDVATLKLVYELPDGGSFIIQDAGGNFRVIAHKPDVKASIITEGLALGYIPMLFSGAIAGRAVLQQEEGLPLRITKQTQRRLLGYDNRLAPSSLKLQRFSVGLSSNFQEFFPEQRSYQVVYTQYDQLRPTWYSGAMSEVMQVVGGYGKQNLDNLPDDIYERAKFEIPQKYQDAIDKELKNTRLPAYTGLPNADGEFQYDYKFLKTNLVSFDDTGNPWLLRVDSSGVWAMPLPIIPATRTNSFYDYMQSVSDHEILAIIDRFGGMPSGETFPESTSAFQAWVRAGVIIKLCDTSKFYANLPFSSAMGWSANTDGTEAINTAYDLNYETGEIIAQTYKMRIRLSSAKNIGWLGDRGDEAKLLTPQRLSRVNAYLSRLFELLQKPTAVNAAIKYKVRSTSLFAIHERALLPFHESEIDYWNNLELKPIATHKATLSMVDRGTYFKGAEVKIPEPMLKGCISIPIPNPTEVTLSAKDGATVIAYYIGNSLKTVKMFFDDRKQQYEVEGNFEKYMYVGAWQQRELIGDAYIKGNLYTTDADDRFVAAPKEINKNIVGKDLGFGHPHFSFAAYFGAIGSLWRDRYYTSKEEVVTITDRNIKLAATMPYYFRNAIVYAKTDIYGSIAKEEIFSLKSVRDPHSYQYWTYHWYAATTGRLPVQNGTPYPVDGRPVYAEIEDYTPSEHNAWADEGSWIPALPYDITNMMYGYASVVWAKEGHPPPPRVDSYSNKTVTQNDTEKELRCQLFERMELVRKGGHQEFYYDLSPDEFMNVFYIDGCKVTFGSNRYANISELTTTGNRKQWGESTLVDNKSAHHFIGVINE